MRQHHSLDIYPVPKEKQPMFINEPGLIDRTIECDTNEPEAESDNVRVYVPLDLNKAAILRRLDEIIIRYGAACEENETDFSLEVERLLFQVEIYDQVWFARHVPEKGEHSREVIELMREFLERLEGIEDNCTECFPFELIEELKKEYL